MKKLLLLGSVVAACPPKKQGGTERVAYYQAKHLAKRGIKIIFVGAVGTEENCKQQLRSECKGDKTPEDILKNIEFIEIGGRTGLGEQEDAVKVDLSQTEASRKLRLETVNLAKIQKLMISRQDDYDVILNNMRGEAIFLPLARQLGKRFINVMHLNLFAELAGWFKEYQTEIITVSNAQRREYSELCYLATIHNPVSTALFEFNPIPKEYALMVATIGYHKNQKDAICAARKAGIKLVLAGKIRDKDYFRQEIEPHIDNSNVVYYGELDFASKLQLYREAKVFLFPIAWQEPFGLVVIEALACGTPVIAYPNGGPAEIIKNGETGFLVNNVNQMQEQIANIDNIDRAKCRQDAEARFADAVIGAEYFKAIYPKLIASSDN